MNQITIKIKSRKLPKMFSKISELAASSLGITLIPTIEDGIKLLWISIIQGNRSSKKTDQAL
jgi:hypothetical protein